MSRRQTIRSGVFFSPRSELPRGRHALKRDQAMAAQRERLMAGFCEAVAERGLAGLTVADVVSRVGVSRSAFYDCFDDLEGCADSSYERFISVLVERLFFALDPELPWDRYVEAGIRAYLGALQSDPVVARAMQIEMDAAGKAARTRRRIALNQMAEVIAARYKVLMQEDPALEPVPVEAHLAMIYGMRQLACDALDTEAEPDLLGLVEPTRKWILAAVYGASEVDRIESNLVGDEN
ncbi:MAG: TetR/AcrR family transcriptional regulator [Solirubrobacterales bacterium]|nr:TetR/AcrR family transcriptional regulator [Solirubrobacterales bacterium]MCB8915163.1 TetR/AcrR family transcriptional regulator [Thermoleophilales bacterium]